MATGGSAQPSVPPAPRPDAPTPTRGGAASCGHDAVLGGGAGPKHLGLAWTDSWAWTELRGGEGRGGGRLSAERREPEDRPYCVHTNTVTALVQLTHMTEDEEQGRVRHPKKSVHPGGTTLCRSQDARPEGAHRPGVSTGKGDGDPCMSHTSF